MPRRYLPLPRQQAVVRVVQDRGRQNTPEYLALADADKVFFDARVELLDTTWAAFPQKVKAVRRQVEALVAAHADLAGPHDPPAAAELLSSYQQVHLGAYLNRFRAAIWEKAQVRFAQTEAGRALLTHVWKVADAEARVLETCVPRRTAELLAAAAGTRPWLTYRQAEAAGIRIDTGE